MVEIVLIDDDSDTGLMVEHVLEKFIPNARLHCIHRTWALDASLGLITVVPSLLILDYYIEGPLDGPGVKVWLDGQEQYRSVPVIGVSASVGDVEIENLKDLGFVAVASKPLDLNNFGRVLLAVINGSRTWEFIPSPRLKLR